MPAAAVAASVIVPLAGAALLAVSSATAGIAGVGVVVLLLQVPLVLAWLALCGSSGSAGGFLLSVVALAAADLLLANDDQATTRALAPVVALALLGSFAHQLARGRHRQAATASMAAEVSAVVIAGSAACWLAVRALPLGREAVSVALAAVAAALLSGRVVDLAVPGPKVVPGGLRGPWGAVVAIVGALGAGAAAGAAQNAVGAANGLVMAAVVAIAVVTTDLAVDMMAAGLPASEFRARSAIPPVAGLLPLVAAAPAAYVAARVLLG
ncbi:MAG: hypothetical protein QOK42_1241 [Frankiaceae bacterium]|jgi:hypothetical protein|nr:hypothetical protein [Frankiaceae bacterium]MDX6224744.1 hypothetical protein [Frankiales bacterium]MDX6275069.1 hypothetical protein [Frankiales bacterium]